jgi:hypothetical protein
MRGDGYYVTGRVCTGSRERRWTMGKLAKLAKLSVPDGAGGGTKKGSGLDWAFGDLDWNNCTRTMARTVLYCWIITMRLSSVLLYYQTRDVARP